MKKSHKANNVKGTSKVKRPAGGFVRVEIPKYGVETPIKIKGEGKLKIKEAR